MFLSSQVRKEDRNWERVRHSSYSLHAFFIFSFQIQRTHYNQHLRQNNCSILSIVVLYHGIMVPTTSPGREKHCHRKDPGQARAQTSVLLVPSCQPDVPCLLQSEWQTIGDP